VVAQEEEDAQEGYEKPNSFHVVPVHGQLHLATTEGHRQGQRLCSPG
jgi:hypothetical protein